MVATNLRRVKLRGYCVNANFTKSEATLWDEWKKKWKTVLKTNECVLFVASSGNQLLFVTRIKEVEGYRGARTNVLDSRRWRLTSGTWHIDMIQNYAHAVGIHIEGFKRFEEVYAERKLKKLLQAAT